MTIVDEEHRKRLAQQDTAAEILLSLTPGDCLGWEDRDETYVIADVSDESEHDLELRLLGALGAKLGITLNRSNFEGSEWHAATLLDIDERRGGFRPTGTIDFPEVVSRGTLDELPFDLRQKLPEPKSPALDWAAVSAASGENL